MEQKPTTAAEKLVPGTASETLTGKRDREAGETEEAFVNKRVAVASSSASVTVEDGDEDEDKDEDTEEDSGSAAPGPSLATPPAKLSDTDTDTKVCALCMEGADEGKTIIPHNCPRCKEGAWAICDLCNESRLSRACPMCNGDYVSFVLNPLLPRAP